MAKDPSSFHADSKDRSDVQYDLSLSWVHRSFVGFVMLWLKYIKLTKEKIILKDKHVIVGKYGNIHNAMKLKLTAIQ